MKFGFIRVIFNLTGYNNEETFGKYILPFWFKEEKYPENIVITLDGAGCHQNLDKIKSIANKKIRNSMP